MVDVSSAELFQGIVDKLPKVRAFLQEHPLRQEPRKIESRWRSINDVFVLETADKKYVLKRINHEETPGAQEIDYQQKLHAAYPGFVPETFVAQDTTSVMEFIEGESLLNLTKQPFEDIYPRLVRAGESLRQRYAFRGDYLASASGVHQLSYTERYKKCRPPSEPESGRFDDARFDAALSPWEAVLREYHAYLIHNDLNSANFLITPENEARAIDSRADVQSTKDLAKDLGRAVASFASATLDRLYSVDQAIAAVQTILTPWETWQGDPQDHELPERIAFYVGQSYLSFSRWDADRIAKASYYFAGLRLLEERAGDDFAFPHYEQVAERAVRLLHEETREIKR